MEKNIIEKKAVITKLPEVDLIRGLDQKKTFSKQTLIALVFIAVLGIGSGFILSNMVKNQNQTGTNSSQTTSNAPAKKVVGVSDEKTYPDKAEGTLEEGGFNGEGTHKLIRPGGDSQTVYLTSSVVDLGQFIGQKVRVSGATFSAKKAGWLMDVGKVEVL
jgi:hypothetical protein